jgi:hypothetical protein
MPHHLDGATEKIVEDKKKILMLFALVKLTWRMMDLMCKLKILGSPTRSLLHQLSMDKLFKMKMQWRRASQ